MNPVNPGSEKNTTPPLIPPQGENFAINLISMNYKVETPKLGVSTNPNSGSFHPDKSLYTINPGSEIQHLPKIKI